MATEIVLSGGGVALVDQQDAEVVSGLRWYRAKRGQTSYAAADIRYPDGSRRSIYMHRLLTGDWPEVDHRNGNGLDNRRCNLRPADREGNNRNQRKKRGNCYGAVPTSRFKGVDRHSASGLWRCRIRVGGGRTVSLGYHADEEAAARAYDVAARRFHGQFAALNFPVVGERAAA